MYIYVCVYIYTHTHIYICIYIHMYIYMEKEIATYSSILAWEISWRVEAGELNLLSCSVMSDSL